MHSKFEQKVINPDIVTIGAGPGGLWNAIKIVEEAKAQGKDIKVTLIERHTIYQRTQRLKLDISLITSKVLRVKLQALVDKKEIDFLDDKNIDIPIQTLEKCLVEHAKSLGIQIVYKKFVTQEQFQAELQENKVEDQKALEEKTKQQRIVGLEELTKTYPDCKFIIGADGARSTVRQLLVDEKEQPGHKKGLRNMIELKYQVHGKVKKLSTTQYFLTQPLLEGLLCSEHVKFHSDKNITEITLRFIVDEAIYNDVRLQGVNAKNPLALNKNIPKKLVDAINIWLNKRGDKNIVIGSPKLNKTKLSIFASAKFGGIFNNTLLLVLGDASCNYPFMNGLNLGLEMGSILAALIVRYIDKIKENDLHAMQEFLASYTSFTKETFRKGSALVDKADKKLTSNQRKVDMAYYSSFPVKASFQYYYNSHHEIFDAHLRPDLEYLRTYVQSFAKNQSSDRYLLSHRLLTRLENVTYAFDWMKLLLCLAYQKYENIETREKNNSFFMNIYLYLGGKVVEAKAAVTARSSLNDNEITEQKVFPILEEPEGSFRTYKKLSTIVGKLYQDISLFQRVYDREIGNIMRATLTEVIPSSQLPKVTNLVEGYLHHSTEEKSSEEKYTNTSRKTRCGKC